MDFNEDYLHYCWQFRLFDLNELQTSRGERIKIISPGFKNTDAGPDFNDAKIYIGDTMWVGNVEIHINSSDWRKHGHQKDRAYHNVILHVVYQHDVSVLHGDGTAIPVLELKDRLREGLLQRYHELRTASSWIPCAGGIAGVDSFVLSNYLSRLLIERFEQKTDEVYALVDRLKGNWNEAFYVFLARSFGFKINRLPFELLALSLPQQLLAKHKHEALQLEALFFGQAGMLAGDWIDDYPRRLFNEYSFLAKKHKLRPIDASLWKWMRMRPLNFPSIRLAQFIALVQHSGQLFSRILELKEVKKLRELFSDIPVNAYWDTHYSFDKSSKLAPKQMGQASIDNILLNTVALFLFAYGKYMNYSHFMNRAVTLLEELPSEKNNIVSGFESLGLHSASAFYSQGLIQLKKFYCDEKKCLNCSIGLQILNR